MRKSRALAIIVSLAVSLCLMLPAQAAQQKATVQGGWLVMRDAPSFAGNILASYPEGTTVTILGQTGSWYEVQDAKGNQGYMLGTFLSLPGTGSAYTGGDEFSYTAYVTSSNGLNVRLRSGPGLGFSILGSYAPGTRCTVLSSGTNWSKIQIGSRIGYMMSMFLTSESGGSFEPVPPQSGVGYTVYVTSRNGYGVNLRSGPDKSYPSIGFYSVGTQAQMIASGSSWSYICIGSRYGYMMSQFLTTTRVQPVTPVYTGSAYVTSANGRNVNLRSGPGRQYGTISSWPVGTPLTVIVRGSQWYYIQIGGTYGFMMRQFIMDPQGGLPTGTPQWEDLTPTDSFQPTQPIGVFQPTQPTGEFEPLP